MEDRKRISWLKLYHYLVHQLNEGEITQESFEDLWDALTDLKCAWDRDEQPIKEENTG